MGMSTIDILWVALSAALVFLMQAGFLSLETGLTRPKNNINVAIKNLADFGLSTLSYWLVGYGLMFGITQSGWLGLSGFLPDFGENVSVSIFFLFQVMFCGTAVTILSGGVAERLRFNIYLIITLLVSTITYPIFGHWVWNGLQTGAPMGWLGQMGFVDFAGSSVVHSVGGWSTLAILLIIGPRTGRFSADGQLRQIPAANMPMAALGVLLLWVGWLGFNGGSTLAMNESVPSVLVNTIMAGAAGLATGIALSHIFLGKPEAGIVFNGSLAGLVAITANAHAVSTSAAVLIGIVGCVVMFVADRLLLRLRIDDAVGAAPVHLAAGIWGTVAVGLFGQADLLGTGLSRLQQLGVQVLGVFICFVWAFGMSYIVLKIINRMIPLRVTVEEEHIGLNVSEHGASTELLDLFTTMEEQSKTGNLSLRVPVEPFTQVGQIGQKYNQVMADLEEVVNRTNAIVKTAKDGIITVYKSSLVIHQANPAAGLIFGYASNEMQGHFISDFISEKHNQAHHDNTLNIAHIVAEGQYREMVGHRADGSSFPLEIAITETKVGKIVFYTVLIRDITVRQEAQQALIARDKAVAANHLKTKILAVISHELRTPLNAIMGFAEMLQVGFHGNLTAQQNQAALQIMYSTERLEGMVNELLDQAQLESGTLKIRPVPFDPFALLQRVQATLGILAETKGLTLTTEISEEIPAILYDDEGRIEQIITNLVGNALKFSKQGTIHLAVKYIDEVHWQIQVTDTGKGIPKEDLPYIFDAFRQVEAVATRSHKGVGLGLSIVKQLVDLMGGDIMVNSVLGQGSTFTITLPLNTIQEQPYE